MEEKRILIDTSILIEYFRKKEKTKSLFWSLSKVYKSVFISTITEYEVLIGASDDFQKSYWDSFFQQVHVISFDRNSAQISAKIVQELKKKNQLIDKADLFIAATAISNNLPIVTLNKKHFERIENLKIIDLK